MREAKPSIFPVPLTATVAANMFDLKRWGKDNGVWLDMNKAVAEEPHRYVLNEDVGRFPWFAVLPASTSSASRTAAVASALPTSAFHVAYDRRRRVGRSRARLPPSVLQENRRREKSAIETGSSHVSAAAALLCSCCRCRCSAAEAVASMADFYCRSSPRARARPRRTNGSERSRC